MNPKETGAYLRQSVFYFKEKVNVDLTRPILFYTSLHLLLILDDIYRLFCISCPTELLNYTTEILTTLLLPCQVNYLPTQLEKMDELCHLPGFRHDAKLIEETGEFDKTFPLNI